MQIGFLNILLLLAYALFMALGQIAFKYVSLSLGQSESLLTTATRLPFNIWFWATGAIYGISMIYWIWLLSRVPVSIAYPFSAFALVILPVLSWFIYSEPLSLRYWTGLLFVVIGILLIVR